MPEIALSLVERGWQDARECSLALERRGARTVHLVKGRLSKDVQRMVTAGSRSMMGFPPRLFWWLVPGCLFAFWLSGRLRAVLVDNDRSYQRLERWLSRLRVDLLRIRRGAEGYEVWRGGAHLERSVWESEWGLKNSPPILPGSRF